ncbi:divergent PAP2 family protein [Natranaerobius trueperi]|uniref:Acid phosphatase n=1 Tax=Natranaerobius trueperi TaxID=759412 RepID=A0A226C099_9FIRM|nr:divergent PAP2 family protein [Natranaerobius trueperi]OWZ84014.1 hypothetical protein CDO51_05500 [Natranaerobius trueperi]
MEFLVKLKSNDFFATAVISWFIAQLLKVLISLLKTKSIDFKLFVASGGMPSSHSAFVMGLTGALGFKVGWESPLTAMALVLSLVVMYDAAGVRRAAGKQAAILNRLIFDSNNDKKLTEKRLKELLGHTPIEVIFGAILGLVVSYLIV